jgi:hypothetical protein
MNAQQYDRMVRSLYDGVLTPGGWQPVLGELRALSNSEVLALLVWDQRSDISKVAEHAGADPEEAAEYASDCALDDPVRDEEENSLPYIESVSGERRGAAGSHLCCRTWKILPQTTASPNSPSAR